MKYAALLFLAVLVGGCAEDDASHHAEQYIKTDKSSREVSASHSSDDGTSLPAGYKLVMKCRHRDEAPVAEVVTVPDDVR